MTWLYDADTRTVFDSVTGDDVCTLSDRWMPDEARRLGRRIAQLGASPTVQLDQGMRVRGGAA